MKKMNVESFNLDHTKVVAPYVRLVGVVEGEHGDRIHKYDVRFCQPNKEHMDMPSLHSLEHLLAELMRNHTNHLIDIGPMGCQTGFYVTLLNHFDEGHMCKLLAQTLEDILVATEVPACNEVQCGWAANHSLEGAQVIARKMLTHRDDWRRVFAE